jgi:hypothetical protein
MSNTEPTPLPASKDAYSFDETTREYLGRVEVFLSPLEGKFYLPRNVVDVEPPKVARYQCARLNAEDTEWEIVSDYRRCMLWDIDTCTPIPNTLTLGDALPANATAEAPPILSSDAPAMNVWDSQAQAWRQRPDYSRRPVWSKDSGQRAPNLAPGEPLPDALTSLSPPHVGEHQAAQWNAQQDGWDIVADYRGVTYWTADGAHHDIDALGVEPPADALTTPPAPTTDEA